MHCVEELVVEKFGPIDAYLQTFGRVQGDVVATFPVRGFEVDPAVKEQRLPVMWGQFVLATKGVGFLPGGFEEGGGVADVLGGFDGGLLGAVMTGLARGSQRVENVEDHARVTPLPLLAQIEPSVVWLARERFDEIAWGPDFGEVMHAGERLCCADTTSDFKSVVHEWANTHAMPFVQLEPAPLLG